MSSILSMRIGKRLSVCRLNMLREFDPRTGLLAKYYYNLRKCTHLRYIQEAPY